MMMQDNYISSPQSGGIINRLFIYEGEQVEDCLSDLDDYLEKMEKNSLQDSNEDRWSEVSVVSRGISSSMRNKNCSTKNFQFVRSSNLRNTVSCTFNKIPIDESELVNPVSNKHAIKNSQLEKKNTETFYRLDRSLDFTSSISENLSDSDKSAYSKNVNLLKRSLQNSSCNNMVSTGTQILTNDKILQNFIEKQGSYMENIEIDRPRQFGRRIERLATVTIPFNQTDQLFEHRITYESLRPMSAPASSGISTVRYNSTILSDVSDGRMDQGSCNSSPVSIEFCTDSSEFFPISNITERVSMNEEESSNQERTQPTSSENMGELCFQSYWPHNYSRTFALISCTLGLFNTSRFALLTIMYGTNFLIQFFILSIVFGIPFLWLQMSLGSKIEAGPISMWKISPICIGIGISIIFVQYCVTIYSSVIVVWLLVYIRDIFIHHSSYPWSTSITHIIQRQSSDIYTNVTEGIPDYLNMNALQRLNILNANKDNATHLHISHVAYYLVIPWTIVFLILCRGLKSFGKIMLFLGIASIIALAVIAAKLGFDIGFTELKKVLTSSELGEFMVNSQTWAAAAQEAFFTWGLLGASIIEISSRTYKNSTKFTLRNDAILVTLVTIIGLCLSALLGLCSIQIVKRSGYVYIPGSYENPDNYPAIFSMNLSTDDHIKYPSKYVPHYSSLIGEVYKSHANLKNISGFQVLRFITELLPSVAVISAENITWTWMSIIFITYLLFGVLQLCVMWKPISCTLGNSISTVLLSCFTGLLLSIPFASRNSITLLHYIDFLLGGAWFIPILWATEILGVFLICGRPYNADDLVNDLKMPRFLSAFLALSWNILLPIGLITLAIVEYKISLSSELYYWNGESYFSTWAKKLGALTQIGFLLIMPISSVIQICRYLSSGPPDIFDRIQMLYRPFDVGCIPSTNEINGNIFYSRYHDETNENSAVGQFLNEAPPKYTPPPSYTTATSARLVKILRQSLRRSMRRMFGEPEGQRRDLSTHFKSENEQAQCSSTSSRSFYTENEINAPISEPIEINNKAALSSLCGRSFSLDRKQILNKRRYKEDYELCVSARNKANSETVLPRTLTNPPCTAGDGITVLRSAIVGRKVSQNIIYSENESGLCSIENLVENEVLPNLTQTVFRENLNEDHQNPLCD